MFILCSCKSNKSILGIVFAAALAGCGNSPNAGLVDEVSLLKAEVARLRGQVDDLPVIPGRTIDLTPTEKEFQFLSTPAGMLAFSVADIAAMGDGSEVSLKIGNLTSATINTLQFHASWGSLDANGDLNIANFRQGDKTIGVPLQPGTWNSVKVTFAGIPPSQMGRISIETPAVTNVTLLND